MKQLKDLKTEDENIFRKIKQLFKGRKQKGITAKTVIPVLRKFPEIEKFCQHILENIPEFENSRNLIAFVLFGRELKRCRTCGKLMKYSQSMLHDFCCVKCKAGNQEIKEKIKKTAIQHFGGIGFASKQLEQKSRNTMQERHGVRYAAQNQEIFQKVKQTNMKKHGVFYPVQNLEIKEKIKNTMSEKYGGMGSRSNQIKEKIKQTNILKFGVENPFQSAEIREKIKRKNLENLGYENPMQSEEIKFKARQTCLKKFGDQFPMKILSVKQKARNSMNEKHGVNYPMQSEKIKAKSKQTCIEKYGCEFSFLSQNNIKKTEQTNIEKFGFRHYSLSVSWNKIMTWKDYVIPLFQKNQWKGFNSAEKYKWKCQKCGNQFVQKIKHTQLEDIYQLPRCLKCYPKMAGQSAQQKQLRKFCLDFYPNLKINSREVIYPLQLDIYIPQLDLAIEFNGSFWHSEINKPVGYHLTKTVLSQQKNIRLIHIWQDEWISGKEKIKEKLKEIFQGKENLMFSDDILKLDRSWFNLIALENYRLKEIIPPKPVERNGFKVENCGYLLFQKIKI